MHSSFENYLLSRVSESNLPPQGACQLIHINPSELSMLDEQQSLCMTEPDFIDVLAGYSLHCRITNDIGGGLFILIKNN